MDASNSSNRLVGYDSMVSIATSIRNHQISNSYRQLAYVLLAETCRKLKLWDLVDEYIVAAGNYWGLSMRMWYDRKNPGKLSHNIGDV